MQGRNSEKVQTELPFLMRRGSARSGPWAIVGIAALGATVLTLFFAAPRVAQRTPDAKWGASRSAIRVIVVDLKQFTGGFDAAIDQLGRAKPDIVFMHGAAGDRLQRASATIGFPTTGGIAFYPAQQLDGAGSHRGNAILSRHPLYEARSIPNRRGSFGVWAVVVIDGMKFYVASAQLSQPQENVESLLAAWAAVENPPILIGLSGRDTTGQTFGLLASHDLLRTNGSGVTTAPAHAPAAPVELIRSSLWRPVSVTARADGWLEVELDGG